MKTERFNLKDATQAANCINLILSIMNQEVDETRDYVASIKIEQTNSDVSVSFECGFEDPASYYECKFEENGTLQ